MYIKASVTTFAAGAATVEPDVLFPFGSSKTTKTKYFGDVIGKIDTKLVIFESGKYPPLPAF